MIQSMNISLMTRMKPGTTALHFQTPTVSVVRLLGLQAPPRSSTQKAVANPLSFGFGITTALRMITATAGSLGRQVSQVSCRMEV